MIRIIVCDDEQSVLQSNQNKLNTLLSKLGIKRNIQCYTNVKNISYGAIKTADIAILDIDFNDNDVTGIQLAKRFQSINKWIAIIFITGHSEYALDAFRLQVFGYLEKPVNELHLERIIKKVLVYLKGIKYETSTFEFLYERKKVTLRQNNIIYVERVNRKIRIVTKQCDYSINGKVSDVENSLMENFLKINSGTLVNLHYVTKIEDCNMYLTDELSFRIARSRLNDVKEKYFSFLDTI
ncbi:LytR/AlgR family response regulator transcription factor [[Clostridium] polysaccharolyticum]|uniref:Stage 0 sporulation protein A homolog n=1 Tax=[Clostridium] polysaccharolyticum TaxID=29364 RepID=A0A1H9YB25_9FIRM|nr:LytTR family DNA-binding domain-containing protein [[Clostridium] polysaccharolyticum]SES65630.1 two component transcriptional regulator, LytTR family [[Clostridium] polysaccharolyticum]